ncbi:hypothetical protein [uncultured Dysosmobacter sp.]|uniref:hypothetical protein n=1 Tax=uncultured Dysosmobacter sp. TaxID=2591384 RepID=UPI00260E5D51|nr:hypothetical protein [uncultured Dysosmobacter sp.]
MYYYGLDIAKYKHEATVIDEAGKALLDSISFSNSNENGLYEVIPPKPNQQNSADSTM